MSKYILNNERINLCSNEQRNIFQLSNKDDGNAQATMTTLLGSYSSQQPGKMVLASDFEFGPLIVQGSASAVIVSLGLYIFNGPVPDWTDANRALAIYNTQYPIQGLVNDGGLVQLQAPSTILAGLAKAEARFGQSLAVAIDSTIAGNFFQLSTIKFKIRRVCDKG